MKHHVRKIDFNAHRAPGPTGVFVSSFPSRFWTWPGWPANDNDRRGRRFDLDAHYQKLENGGR